MSKTTDQKHTALPWEQLDGGSVIYSKNDTERDEGYRVAVARCGDEIAPRGGLKYGTERDGNAEFIVRACNSHYELLEALTSMVDGFSPGSDYSYHDVGCPATFGEWTDCTCSTFADLRKAKETLTRATEGEKK